MGSAGPSGGQVAPTPGRAAAADSSAAGAVVAKERPCILCGKRKKKLSGLGLCKKCIIMAEKRLK